MPLYWTQDNNISKELREIYQEVAGIDKEITDIYQVIEENGILVNKRIYASFEPVDMTWNTPGMYMFNVGQANRVYISAKGADGGSGGGGGYGGMGDTQTAAVSTTFLRGGLGGTGREGADGAQGANGIIQPRFDDFFNVIGGGGGGGEAGETPSQARVLNGSIELISADSGRGGRGGNGNNGRHVSAQVIVPGGVGGIETLGIDSTTLTGQVGGIGANNGGQGRTGEELDEQLFTITEGSILTIIVPAKGLGGNPGLGGMGLINGSDGGIGSDGVDNGWIRIRTERV